MPSSTRPPLITSTCDGDRERPGRPERRRAHQRAEADVAGLARQAGQGDPRVGGTGARVALADALQVVGPEERVEPEILAGPGHAEEVVVGSALLRLGEDAEIHVNAPTYEVSREAEPRTGVDVMS